MANKPSSNDKILSLLLVIKSHISNLSGFYFVFRFWGSFQSLKHNFYIKTINYSFIIKHFKPSKLFLLFATMNFISTILKGSEFLYANILRIENSNLDLNLGRGAQTAFSPTATGAFTEES